MSRILIIFLAGLLTAVISFITLWFTGSNGGLTDILSEVPFFRSFVEMSESIVSLETGNPVAENPFIKNLLIIVIIMLLLRLIRSIINWIVNVFIIQKPLDKTMSAVNKKIWNLIFSMASIIVGPMMAGSMYDNLEDKTNSFTVFSVTCIFAGVVLVLSMLWGIYIKHQRPFFSFLRSIFIPSVQAILLISVYSFFYCALKTEYYILFFTFILCAIIVYFVLDFLSDKLFEFKKVNKED